MPETIDLLALYHTVSATRQEDPRVEALLAKQTANEDVLLKLLQYIDGEWFNEDKDNHKSM